MAVGTRVCDIGIRQEFVGIIYRALFLITRIIDPGLFTCNDMLHTITLLILSKGYSPLQVKHTVGILLFTNMFS